VSQGLPRPTEPAEEPSYGRAVRRTFVVDDTVGGAPALGLATLVTAAVVMLLDVPPLGALGPVAAAGLAYCAFHVAGWRLAPRMHRVTVEDDGATFATGRHIENVDRAAVKGWAVELRGANAVILSEEADERPRVVLTAGAHAAPYLREIVDVLESDATHAQPDGGYRQAPNDAHLRRDSMTVVRRPATARSRRAAFLALLVVWTSLWAASAYLFAQAGPEVPWLAHAGAVLGSLALAAIAGATLHDPTRKPLASWANLGLPRSRALAWPLAIAMGAGAAWSFARAARPLDLDANRQACHRGEPEGCWYAAHGLVRAGQDDQAIPYLEKACHGGRARACSYRAARIGQLSPVRADSMLARGCGLGDVSSCTHLEGLRRRRGDEPGAGEARARACALDARRCKTP
jgi:hypothetical protein